MSRMNCIGILVQIQNKKIEGCMQDSIEDLVKNVGRRAFVSTEPSISQHLRHGLYDLQGLLRVCVVDEKNRERRCSIHLIAYLARAQVM